MASLDLAKPTQLWELTFEGDWPTSVAFLGSTHKVAAGNREGKIYVWDLPEEAPDKPTANEKSSKRDMPDLAPVRLLEGHRNGITHLLSTRDGNTLVSSSLDRTVRLWNPNLPAEGKVSAIMDMDQRRSQARRKSEVEQKKILEAPGIEVEVQRAHEVLAGHQDWVKALGMSGDETRLISGDDGCLSIVWDLASRKEVSRWNGYDRVWITSAALSPDGQTAFTAEFAGSRDSFDRPAAQARLWNVADGTLKLDLLKVWTPKIKENDRTDSYGYASAWGKIMGRGLICSDWSPDGKLIAAGMGGENSSSRVHLIDVETGKIVHTVNDHRNGVCDVRFSPDGKYVLSSGRDTMVQISDVANGKTVAKIGAGRGGQSKDWIHAIALSADRKLLAMADIAGKVQVWRLD